MRWGRDLNPCDALGVLVDVERTTRFPDGHLTRLGHPILVL